MSLDPSAFPRSNSPASSESSLTRQRLQGKEGSLKKDKSYRRYASSVERALSLFDNALQEWADYISFLSRLLKALQTHPPDQPVVPHKLLVSKRLAQCLNPSLPSGVHQKALEVYTYIFGLIKLEGLSHDLPLYLPGLAPTLTFASLTVRPLFLSLVEGYIVDLEPWAIRPALKAIILALLPGLEEETSDDFEPTLRILNKLCDVSGHLETQRTSEAGASGQYFWQCLFLASITNSSRRLGVLAYLNRYLPKLGIADRRPSVAETGDAMDIPPEMLAAADSVILPEPGLLIRCFASGLSDEQLLVQRNFLDLLVSHLPLNSPVLQTRLAEGDLETLIISAVGVVARRDMSLNRRLWSWFLGPEPANERSSIDGRKFSSETARSASVDGGELSQSQYFSRVGLQPLVNGLLKMIKQAPMAPSERTKPFRISLSLMDRWEIGGYIVPAVFLPTMHSVQAFEKDAPQSHFEEVFRSASAFFDGVESSVIFSELLHLVDFRSKDVEKDHEQVMRGLNLARFILENFNVREEDMIHVHVPLLTVSVLVKMSEVASMTSRIDKQAISNGLNDVLKSLTPLLTERVFSRKTGQEKSTADGKVGSAEILKRVHQFYEISKNSLDLPPLPFAPKHIGEMIIREAHDLCVGALKDDGGTSSLNEKLNILVTLLQRLPKSRILRDRRLYEAISQKLAIKNNKPTTAAFAVISTIASSVTNLFFIHNPGFYVSYEDACDLIPSLVEQLWQYLSPSSPKFHVEAVRCLWLLHSISWVEHLVEASITSLMVSTAAAGAYHLSSEEKAEKFFVLWNHSHHGAHEHPPKQVLDVGGSLFSYQCTMLERPLFIVLDLLSQEPGDVSQCVQQWLQDLPTIHKIFHVLISKIEELFDRDTPNEATDDNQSISADDYKECYYLLRTASNIISILSHNGWIILLSHTLSQAENRPETAKPEDNSSGKSLHATFFEASLRIISDQTPTPNQVSAEGERLQKDALHLMRQLLLGPGAEDLVESGIDEFLVERLLIASEGGSVAVQGAIIDALLAALKVRFAQAYVPPPPPRPKHQRAGSRERLTSPSILSFTSDKQERKLSMPQIPRPPERLLDCLLKGISSAKSREIVDKWIGLLCEVLPLYSGQIFQILLMLVECFCREIRASFGRLQLAFQQTEEWPQDRSEHVTIALLTGLETCIANAHERLLVEESNVPAVKSPDQPQGFFGNMVSGVFHSEGNQGRSNTANDRLTVLLCFQDAVRLCFSIWAWGAGDKSGIPPDSESMASFQYTALRMRNRSRRILEHFFTAEALECLETLVEMWTKSDMETANLIFSLLHTLDGSRPKIAIPAVFNAIYTRTNPGALDNNRKSSLTSNLSESELASFLVAYARSLDDDVLDEIWTDCTTFLRDVLSNPFPHRQILPRLIEFAAILGTKLENTTFGEDRRMRKELGVSPNLPIQQILHSTDHVNRQEVLLRLLTAVFTSKPMGHNQDSGLMARSSVDYDQTAVSHTGPDDMLSILAVSMPSFITTLGDSDRINTAISGVSTNVVGPLIRSRLFPNNLNRNVMILLQHMAKVPAAAKVWKKDIADAFNDPRFFGLQVELVKATWLDLLRQWVLADKERLADLLARLPPPSTAGIMFGVGASAARLEADRKAQLNLRRIALLLLSANEDYFVGELPGLLQKLEDLLAATSSSSPSSATRAEIFMVLRALALKTSTSTMASFWPLINMELQEAISAVPRGSQSELYNSYSLLQACKLLDTLLVIAPDDFQLIEWLFVTDTIDAVYPPNRWEPIALADEVSQSFGPRGVLSPAMANENAEPVTRSGLKRPWLISHRIRETAKDEIVERVLRPFFDRLSIYVFESTYGMESADLGVCQDDLLADLFNESTMAN